MSVPPKGKADAPLAASAPDRTTAVVAGGLVLLAALGALTIFSGPLMALVAPPAEDGALGASGPSSAQTTTQTTTIGRSDGGTHS